MSVNLTVGQIKALMALPLAKDASSDLLGARQALREAVNKASPEGRPSILAEGETPKAAVVHAKRSETDAVADAKERMKPMGLDELKNVLAKNRLWVEMKAPNNGVLVMRIKNAIYNRINTGVQFKW